MEIGVQFYTLRQHCRNLDDFAETMKKVADIGYKNIQVSGVCDYEPEWLREQLNKNGLKCVVTHAAVPKLNEDPAKICRNHDVFDCDYVGLGFYNFSLTQEGNLYQDFLNQYMPIVKTVNENGKKFTFHNHAKEFMRLDNGKAIIEQMAEDFTSDQLNFLLDVCWVQAAGGDAAAWIEKLKGRIPFLHVKDFRFNPDFKVMDDHVAVLGEGNMNFDRIFEKAESSGVKCMLVEQDSCHGEDAFDCIKRSYNYLKSHGF